MTNNHIISEAVRLGEEYVAEAMTASLGRKTLPELGIVAERDRRLRLMCDGLGPEVRALADEHLSFAAPPIRTDVRAQLDRLGGKLRALKHSVKVGAAEVEIMGLAEEFVGGVVVLAADAPTAAEVPARAGVVADEEGWAFTDSALARGIGIVDLGPKWTSATVAAASADVDARLHAQRQAVFDHLATAVSGGDAEAGLSPGRRRKRTVELKSTNEPPRPPTSSQTPTASPQRSRAQLIASMFGVPDDELEDWEARREALRVEPPVYDMSDPLEDWLAATSREATTPPSKRPRPSAPAVPAPPQSKDDGLGFD